MMDMLIIRPGAVGDALLTFPVIMALRRDAPELQITFVSNAAVLELARVLGVADEAYDYGESLWSELFSAHGIRHPELQALLKRVSLALCWLSDPAGVVARNLQVCGVEGVLVARGRPYEGTQQHVVNYLAQTIGLTIDITDAFRPPRPLAITESKRRVMLAVHPGSGGARKCWPVERFAEVIQAMWERQIPVLLLAGPADHARLEHLLALLGAPPQPALLTLLRDAPLLEVAQALASCKGFLGNDAGITHLAALLGLPAVVLFGPTDPVVWRPIGPQVHVLQANALANLHVSTVFRKIEELLR